MPGVHQSGFNCLNRYLSSMSSDFRRSGFLGGNHQWMVDSRLIKDNLGAPRGNWGVCMRQNRSLLVASINSTDRGIVLGFWQPGGSRTSSGFATSTFSSPGRGSNGVGPLPPSRDRGVSQRLLVSGPIGSTTPVEPWRGQSPSWPLGTRALHDSTWYWYWYWYCPQGCY